MKKAIILVAAALLLMTSEAGADTLARLDSLLNSYGSADGARRTATGKELLGFFGEQKVFFGDAVAISDGDSRKVQDMKVWFAAERYYTTASYYAEALRYNELAMPLAQKADDDIAATLLCDKSYCLFKRSDYTQAIEAGQQAKQFCKKTGNKMQLSRSYLYLALVNHAMRNYDEAMQLVEKSIATNAELGINVQTHNALGVACEIFCSAHELERAVSYGLQAVEAARAIDYMPGVANHLTQLSYAYNRQGEFTKGLQVADSAVAIVMAHEPIDRNQLAITLEFKSWNLLDMHRNREAADVMREAIRLETEVGNIHAACYDYRTLCEALEPIDPSAALKALQKYTVMSDSLHTAQLKELMSKANAEVHNDELKEENAQSRQRTWTVIYVTAAVVALLLVAIVSLLMAFRYKNRSAKALKRLSEVRENFFVNVTHELRTPLTVILGLGRDLQREAKDMAGLSPDWLQQTGEMIERQGNSLLSLMNQLLDLSKVRSELAPQPAVNGNMGEYVATVVETHREVAVRKGITLDYTFGDDLWTAYVPDYMQKVVGNLLSNAIKFTPQGGRVAVGLHRRGSDLLLEVSDTGQGISADELPHIFEPFYQTAEGQSHEGTGIGLALVKQIVETLGGRIDVGSSPQGTRFSIALPAIRKKGKESVAGTADAPKPTVAQQTDDAETADGRRTVLVVEDNADVARLIGRQLAGRYAVVYAADGQEGIEQARRLLPDLIITDLMMPNTDGLQLCATLRGDSLTDHIPIIVLTARVSVSDRISGIKAGADAYLCKPFNDEEMQAVVEHLLEQQATLRRKYSQAVGDNTAVAMQGQTVGAAPMQQEGTSEEETPSARGSAEFVRHLDETIARLMEQGDCDVEHVAAEMCLSTSQLRRKMNAIIGTAPKKYIMTIRLQQAYDMLKEHPERTISDVAERCGFYDHSHFIRAFREAYGMLPGRAAQP
ncbi:MAG: response regulator [Prevotella sp.]|nr:response regulator [Prevotella sp.]